MLILPTQDKLCYAVQLCFQQGEKVSNNIAEYEGLIAGLKAAVALGVKRLTIKGDSQLLVNFSNKVYELKDEHMEAYLKEVRKIEKQFLGLELQHVPRGTNKEADDIDKRASKRLPQEECWITEFKDYLIQGMLQEKEEDAERIARQATAYCIRDTKLY